jgi:hypothetical protein
MAGGAALPRLRWRGARGPFAVEPWAAGAGGAGLSSLFVRLSPSAGDGGVWLARSLALLLSRGPGARVAPDLLPSMALPLLLPVGYCPCGLFAVFSAPASSCQPLGSVVVRKKHGGDGPLPFPANVIGDDPDGAVLGGVVAGEEAPIARAGGEVVGGIVFRVEIDPIAGGVAIKEGGEERVGNGGGDSGSGDNAAEVVEHGLMGCGGLTSLPAGAELDPFAGVSDRDARPTTS